MDTIFTILPSIEQTLTPLTAPRVEATEPLISGAYYKIGLKSKPGKF